MLMLWSTGDGVGGEVCGYRIQVLLSFIDSYITLLLPPPSLPPQVYVRRSYTAYDVTCVQHEELEGGMPIVQWQFLLPLSHPNRCGC